MIIKFEFERQLLRRSLSVVVVHDSENLGAEIVSDAAKFVFHLE